MLHSLFVVELRKLQAQDSTGFTREFVCICSSLNSAVKFCHAYDPHAEVFPWWFAILETTVNPSLISKTTAQAVAYVLMDGTVTNEQPITHEKVESDLGDWLKLFEQWQIWL